MESQTNKAHQSHQLYREAQATDPALLPLMRDWITTLEEGVQLIYESEDGVLDDELEIWLRLQREILEIRHGAKLPQTCTQTNRKDAQEDRMLSQANTSQDMADQLQMEITIWNQMALQAADTQEESAAA